MPTNDAERNWSGNRNWSENIEYTAAAVLEPSSMEELQEIVSVAARVKALGTRHSFTTVADSPQGALVSLARLDATVRVDRSAMTASVPAGASYGVVAPQLDAAGVALANMGSLPHISVGGATATGTHGSGDAHPVLASAIRSLDLVTATGELETVDRAHADFPAIAAGLGAFGLITRIELDVEPRYEMRQDVYRGIAWATALEHYDEFMAAADSVNHQGRFTAPADTQAIVKSRVVEHAPDQLLGAPRDDEDRHAGPQHTPRRGVPGPWHLRLPHFHLEHPPSVGGDELQSDYMVARADAPQAIAALRSIGPEIDEHLWGFEIRSVAADDFWMSAGYGRDSVSIGFTWRKHIAEVTALLPRVEQALAPYEPRPHWGKLFAIPGATLRQRLPHYDDFFDAVERWDHERKFANPFLDSLRPT